MWGSIDGILNSFKFDVFIDIHSLSLYGAVESQTLVDSIIITLVAATFEQDEFLTADILMQEWPDATDVEYNETDDEPTVEFVATSIPDVDA